MLESLLEFFFPRMCPVCGRRLEPDERPLCLRCNIDLPRTMFWENPYDNPMARMYWGKIPVEKAVSYFYYRPQAGPAHLIYDSKYHGARYVAEELGEMMADEMKDFFDGIDCIMPVPLSVGRRLERGYNQSEMIAKGLSKVSGIPISRYAVVRKRFAKSQTSLTRIERMENVEDAFLLKDAEMIEGKHVLIVDDVITTGSTTLACAKEVLKASGTKVSFLSLGYAHKPTANDSVECSRDTSSEQS